MVQFIDTMNKWSPESRGRTRYKSGSGHRGLERFFRENNSLYWNLSIFMYILHLGFSFYFFFFKKKQSTNICNFSIIGSFYRILNLITDLTKCLRCCLFFIWNLNFTYSQTFITFNLFVFYHLYLIIKCLGLNGKKIRYILTFILMAKTSKWNFNIITH